MATTTYTSTSPSPLTKEWLSLPRDLAIDDSFADDLIRQFDKKRTGLHKDNHDQESEKSTSPLPTAVTTRASSTTTNPTPRPNRITTRTSSRTSSMIVDTPSPPLDTTRRRSSAGNLLRRSSAFVKATLDQTWKNISRPSNENLRHKESHQDQQDDENDTETTTPSLPATVAINTTITLPISKKTSQSSFPALQPPVISQYPPKPLQYSLVTPTDSFTDLSASPHHGNTRPKTLIHRISMPALRRRVSNFSNNNNSSNSDQQQVTSSSYRRKSDSANPLFMKRKKSNQP